MAAVGYAVYIVAPSYTYFSGGDFQEKWMWKADGFDDPEVRRKAHEGCMAGLKAPANSGATPFPREDLDQLSAICSRPGWVIGTPGPSWWETPVAFISSVGAWKIAYRLVAVLFGPWVVGFLVVRPLPTGMARLWRWLTTPDATP